MRNIGLVVNAMGKMCLVYDEVFEQGAVYCFEYHLDIKKIEIIFMSGETYLIDWRATDDMHDFLLKINRILMIRMENKKPVEGWDTSFLFNINSFIPKCYSNGGYALFMNMEMQPVLILPSNTKHIKPDNVEFNGHTGSFSLICGEEKLMDVITLSEEYSSLQRDVLSLDRINVVWRSPKDEINNGKILKYYIPLTVTFNKKI